jgi:tRNA threonylcarbamoyladenosine biosynthesis protein TsaE
MADNEEASFLCRSAEETKQLAASLAGDLTAPELIAFFGELGSGKTTFIQGLGQGLGISERIVSPTFVLVRRYPLKLKGRQSRLSWFYHLDLYRADGEAVVEELALVDLWQREDVIVALEWADRVESRLPARRIEVRCKVEDEQTRKFDIKRLR